MTKLQQELNSLRAADAHEARRVLDAFAREWDVDRHDDYDGNVLLIVTPPGPEHATPVFTVRSLANGMQLAIVLGDTYETLGTFKTMGEALVESLLHSRIAQASLIGEVLPAGNVPH